ncbi:MAG: HlyD family secretion protein [Limisphaerales bacterium]
MSDPAIDPHHRVDDPMPFLADRAGFAALDLPSSLRRVRFLSKSLSFLFVLCFVAVAFLPWRQFIQGSGRVIAYNPLERTTVIEAPLAGRVQTSHVMEGQYVRQGDLLFELTDNDPNLLVNLQQQLQLARQRRDAARERLEALNGQVSELERAMPLGIEAARARLDVARVSATTASQQFQRIESLFKDQRGLASQRDFELAQLDRDRTTADLARSEVELRRTEVDLRASLNSAMASRDSAKADFASADQAAISLEIQVNQTQNQKVLAPRDGYIMRLQVTEGTFLRAGSPLCTLIPQTSEPRVELYVSGNDMPLIQARVSDERGNVISYGSPVRLQFEGWPALQLIGWPSLAVGTFGGEVILVDPTDNGQGKFRILVGPRPDVVTRDGKAVEIRDWPENQWLRQGIRANGWVLLQEVPLWFEIWRQLNGFPPALTKDQIGGLK